MPGSAFGVCSVSVCELFAPSDTVTVTVPPSPALTIGTGAVGSGVPSCVLLPQTRSPTKGAAKESVAVIDAPDTLPDKTFARAESVLAVFVTARIASPAAFASAARFSSASVLSVTSGVGIPPFTPVP